MRRLGRMAPTATKAQIEATAGLWFADLLGLPESEVARSLAAGRVAWLVTGAARRWPLALFAEAPPVALAEAVRRGMPTLPPPLLGDAMPPAELRPQRTPQLAAKPLRARPA